MLDSVLCSQTEGFVYNNTGYYAYREKRVPGIPRASREREKHTLKLLFILEHREIHKSTRAALTQVSEEQHSNRASGMVEVHQL